MAHRHNTRSSNFFSGRDMLQHDRQSAGQCSTEHGRGRKVTPEAIEGGERDVRMAHCSHCYRSHICGRRDMLQNVRQKAGRESAAGLREYKKMIGTETERGQQAYGKKIPDMIYLLFLCAVITVI